MKEETRKQPRLMLAATKSGSGKTLITCGVLRLLQRQGKTVSAFKCGPDYIDPMFHRTVLKVPTGNLDTFFTDDATTIQLLSEGSKGTDIAVIEGVMGYFDGGGRDGRLASAQSLAAVTRTPVILIVDAAGAARSVVPVVKGFVDYDETKQIRGVLLNRVSGGICGQLKKWIEEAAGVPVIGYLPKIQDVSWESRHLGLMMPQEMTDVLAQIDRVADTLAETADTKLLLQIAEAAEALPEREVTLKAKKTNAVRVAVARDEAFCFCYEENLRLMEEEGAALTFFSPLHDSTLPEADLYLFGGGYPELHAPALSENEAMLRSVRAAAADGAFLLAECGGFMYLQESMETKDGVCCPMAGVLEGRSFMTDRLVRFGYLTLKAAAGASDTLAGRLLGEDQFLRGHEFHYFDTSKNGDVCVAEKTTGNRSYPCMQSKERILAGFPHLYYLSNPKVIRKLFALIAESRK